MLWRIGTAMLKSLSVKAWSTLAALAGLGCGSLTSMSKRPVRLPLRLHYELKFDSWLESRTGPLQVVTVNEVWGLFLNTCVAYACLSSYLADSALIFELDF